METPVVQIYCMQERNSCHITYCRKQGNLVMTLGITLHYQHTVYKLIWCYGLGLTGCTTGSIDWKTRSFYRCFNALALSSIVQDCDSLPWTEAHVVHVLCCTSKCNSVEEFGSIFFSCWCKEPPRHSLLFWSMHASGVPTSSCFLIFSSIRCVLWNVAWAGKLLFLCFICLCLT